MEVAFVRAQLFEFKEATMARSLHGFNREVQDIVELYHYTSLANLVHQANMVELLLKRHQASKKSYPSSSWNIKGFKWLGKKYIASQYPNRRTMVLRDDGSMESKSSHEDSSSCSEVKSSSDGSHDKDDLLMERRLMNNLVGEDV
ncbi:hypothetical protein CR513_16930, partial [Mucuna pruriens]